MDGEPVVRATGIVKSFGRVRVLAGVPGIADCVAIQVEAADDVVGRRWLDGDGEERIGERAAAAEDVLEDGLHLVLVETGGGESHRLGVTAGGERAGSTQTLDLLLGLDQTHLGEKDRYVPHRRWDRPPVSLAMASSPGDDPADPVVVVGVSALIPESLAPDHEPGQHGRFGQMAHVGRADRL